MADDDNNLVFEITPSENPGGSVFLLRTPYEMSVRETERIIQTWTSLWQGRHSPVPALLIMPKDMELTSLSDDKLAAVGLMRIVKHEDRETGSLAGEPTT